MEGVRTTTPTMNKFKLSRLELEVLIAFAKGGMRISKASDMLHMSSTSVDSYLCKIYQRTGINPRDFFGIGCLLNARCIYQENACFIVYDGGNERIEFKGNSNVYQKKEI